MFYTNNHAQPWFACSSDRWVYLAYTLKFSNIFIDNFSHISWPQNLHCLWRNNLKCLKADVYVLFKHLYWKYVSCIICLFIGQDLQHTSLYRDLVTLKKVKQDWQHRSYQSDVVCVVWDRFTSENKNNRTFRCLWLQQHCKVWFFVYVIFLQIYAINIPNVSSFVYCE